MAFAFFDLDQTILPYDTQAYFCQHVLHREGWRRSYLAFFLPMVPLKALHLIGTRELKRAFLSYLWKMPKKTLQAHVESFVQEKVVPVLYPEIVAEVKRHLQEGRTTILNTASPDVYAPAIAQYLGFHHCFATGVDTGGSERFPFFPLIPGPNNKRAAKLAAMAHLLPAGSIHPETSEPLSVIPDSWAYSDSHADLPMLRLAENAVMVHPTQELRAEGEAKGWACYHPQRPFSGRAGYRMACFRQAFGL